MRLIDADEVIKLLEENANVSKEPLSLQVNNIRLIKRMSTAYDIDNVVEKLEELKRYNLSLGDAVCDIQKNGVNRHFVCLEDVIDIVKRGGKE